MNPAPALVLAIDVGTSGPKVALSTSDGEILTAASRSVDTLFPVDGSAEQDAEQIWRAVLEAAAQVLGESKVSGGRVAGVAVTSQFSSIVPVDRQGLPFFEPHNVDGSSRRVLWTTDLSATPGRARDLDRALEPH